MSLKVEKSVGVSVILTILLNFWGLLYSSFVAFLIVGVLWVGGFVFAIVAITESGEQVQQELEATKEDRLAEHMSKYDESIATLWTEEEWREQFETIEEWSEAGASIGTGLGGFILIFIWSGFTWIVSIVTGIMATQRHNRKVAEQNELATEARHQETLATLQQTVVK